MSYPLEARCPACQTKLDAEILVRCEGHDVHEVGLALAVAAEPHTPQTISATLPGEVQVHCWGCGWTMRHLAPLGVRDLIDGHLVACPGPVDSLCGRTRHLHERGQQPVMLREARP